MSQNVSDEKGESMILRIKPSVLPGLLFEYERKRERILRQYPEMPVNGPKDRAGMSRRDAARHEAGHILAGAITGATPVIAALVEMGTFCDGVVCYYVATNSAAPGNTMAVTSVAGMIAEGAQGMGLDDARAFLLAARSLNVSWKTLAPYAVESARSCFAAAPAALDELALELDRFSVLRLIDIRRILAKHNIRFSKASKAAIYAAKITRAQLLRVAEPVDPTETEETRIRWDLYVETLRCRNCGREYEARNATLEKCLKGGSHSPFAHSTHSFGQDDKDRCCYCDLTREETGGLACDGDAPKYRIPS